MTNKHLILICCIIIIILVGGPMLFHSEEDVIKERLDEVAELMTKEKGEGAISLASKVSKALEYFHPPCKIRYISSVAVVKKTIRAETKQVIKENIAMMKLKYPWVIVKIQDTQVELDGDKAQSNSRARMQFEDSQQGSVYDLFDVSLKWKKVDGTWLINKVLIEQVVPDQKE